MIAGTSAGDRVEDLGEPVGGAPCGILGAMTSRTAAVQDPGGLRARLQARRTAVLASAGRHGARNVRLFGSLARGDHTESSDIDLLVDFDEGVGLFQVARLVAELEELLQSHVDVVSANALRPWDDDVLEEAIPL